VPEFTVRRAVAADAPAIGHVQVAGWHEAYTGRMPRSILDGLDVERSTRGWRRAMAGDDADERGEVWVAETGGDIVGFAASGRDLDADAPPGRRQLYALYVLAAYYGSGAGQALLDAALGRGAASLWILADNPRARAFYERNGFRPDGAEKDDESWGEAVHEVRLLRPALP
jgi:ribosomal protein S18 acetylase RimI-like enzyme